MPRSLTYQTPIDLKTRRLKDGDYFFLTSRNDDNFFVTCGGIENCSSNYSIERTEFQFYSIEYIVAGKCRLSMGDKEQILSPGHLFSCGPGTTYKLESLGNTPLIKRFIEFGGDAVPEAIKGTLIEQFEAHNLRHESWIKEALQNMHDCGALGGENANETCNYLLRYLISRIQQVETLDNETCTPSYVAFETCKSYLENYYKQINGANEVANACNVSHPHLCRLFKRFSDETPTKMLLRLKLTESIHLLEQGNLLVKEVAEKVGFEDQYYFSKRFKEYFGVSPKNYLGSENIQISA